MELVMWGENIVLHGVASWNGHCHWFFGFQRLFLTNLNSFSRSSKYLWVLVFVRYWLWNKVSLYHSNNVLNNAVCSVQSAITPGKILQVGKGRWKSFILFQMGENTVRALSKGQQCFPLACWALQLFPIICASLIILQCLEFCTILLPIVSCWSF